MQPDNPESSEPTPNAQNKHPPDEEARKLIEMFKANRHGVSSEDLAVGGLQVFHHPGGVLEVSQVRLTRMHS